MDKWKSCQRISEDHFLDRIRERHLPYSDIERVLLEGIKIKNKDSSYTISWKSWKMIVMVGDCFITLKTVFQG